MEVIKFTGLMDTMTLFEDRLVLRPRGIMGFLTKGLMGTKEIPYASITAIQLKEVKYFINGYIQFSILGGKESTGGLNSAVKDENTVVFWRARQNEEAKKIKRFIQERMGFKALHHQQMPLVDQIEKVKRLLDNEAITKEEFARIKADLINRNVSRQITQ